MKRIPVIIAFLCYFLSGCNKTTNSSLPVINMDPSYARDYLFSEIGIVNSIVPLESNSKSIISSISDLRISGDTLFIADKSNINFNRVHMFLRNGKYLQQIGKYGRGPDEILIMGSFHVQKEKGLIYIQDLSRKKVITYSYDNRFIEEYVFKSGYPTDFVFLDSAGGFITYMSPIKTKEGQNIHLHKLTWERNNMVLKSLMGWHNDPLINFIPYRVKCSRFIRLKNSIHYYETFNDTVFSVSPDSVSHYAKFDFGDGWIKPAEILQAKNQLEMDELQKSKIHRFELSESDNFGTVKFFVLNSEGNYDRILGIFNKFNMESKIIKKLGDQINFIHLCNQYFMTGDDELCMVIEPYRIRQALEELKKMNITLTGIEKELEQIMQGVKAEDNPILIFTQLKK
jgi:hypothetical protein